MELRTDDRRVVGFERRKSDPVLEASLKTVVSESPSKAAGFKSPVIGSPK